MRDSRGIARGTVIATFNPSGRYEGHAAIYASQSAAGVLVYDQYVTPPSPKPIGPRVLRWGAHGVPTTGITSMWSSRAPLALLLSVLCGCSAPVASAADVCPAQGKSALRSVDVFDGSPEQLAFLVPDETHARSGYWQLDYVYDASRFVSVRCRYADGSTVEEKLTRRVSRCDYRIDDQKTLTVRCH